MKRTKKFTAIVMIALLQLNLISCVMFDKSPVKPEVKVAPTTGNSSGIGLPKPGAQPNSSSRFATNYCTWYAASEFDKIAPAPGCNWGGDAGTWVGNASAAGWRTYAYPSYDPQVAGYFGLPPGTIVVWTGGGNGHVAIVRSVFQNGIYIQEKNWPVGSGVSPLRLLFWSDVMKRGTNGSYHFSGYIAPWRR